LLQPQAGSAQFQPDGKCTAPTAYQVHGHLRLRPRAQDAVSDRAAGGRRRSRPRVQDAVAIEQEEKQAGSNHTPRHGAFRQVHQAGRQAHA